MESGRKPLIAPALKELGIAMHLQMGLSQPSFTLLRFRVASKKAILSQAQAFDATGRAWPTFFHRENDGDEENTCQILIAGQPSPPLSLALMANTSEGGITLPIVLERIPVGSK